MTRTELDRLNDHDLLVLLHERIRAHSEEHRQAKIEARWMVGIAITALMLILTAVAVLGSLGNP